MSGLINKVKDALHHDKDTTHTGTTGTHTTGTHTTGTHTTGTGVTGNTYGSTNAGPHDSNTANKLDPRVDSDLDGGRHGGLNQTSTAGGHPHTTSGVGGTHGSTNAGPHDSNVLNKLDPRVDSDLDGSRNLGANQTSTGGYGTTGTHTGTHSGSGLTGTHGTHTSGGLTGTSGSSTTAGPHSSNIANKLDPRVDSDLDGSRNLGANQTTGAYGSTGTHSTGTGLTGSHGGSTNAGHHSSNLANKADPRIDSDLDGSRNLGGNTTGGYGTTGTHTTGTHTTGSHTTGSGTQGPHGSNLLNKLDPRVDSNADGKAGPLS